MAIKPYFFDLKLDEVEDLLQDWGLKRYRSAQLWEGIYQQLLATPQEITNLSLDTRHRLEEELDFSHLDPVVEALSTDGETRKVLFELPDGARIETVLMGYEERNTLCISSQAGCAMNCSFCATGQMGFTRNLSPGEIIEQVIYFARYLKNHNITITNIVFMGMGEPFHNYDAVMKAIEILNHPQGMNLGQRRFTISTVGLIPGIRKFTAENSQVNLAVSLHATTDDARSAMMPVNNRYPISELIEATRNYFEQTSRRVTFEWALIENINDSINEAERLADLLEGLTCHVNVIPLNPTAEFSGKRSNQAQVNAFRDKLIERGIACTIRVRRGIDIDAGCGQLAIKHKSEN